MDPNVQVAAISVFSTFIITIGVIAVAIINNRKERGGAASAGVEAGMDEKDVLIRMLSLISENERKEAMIQSLKATVLTLKRENRALKAGKEGVSDV